MAVKAKINMRAVRAFVNKVEGVKTAFGEVNAKKLGQDVVEEMRAMIAKGVSPVGSAGRFPAYKHAGVKGKYPDSVKNDYPGKKARPVNLYLSGHQMESLSFVTFPGRFGYGVEIGYYNSLAKKKEQGHAEGVNGQPKRPTIPQINGAKKFVFRAGGNDFAIKIQQLIFRAFQDAVRDFVRRK